MFNSLRSAHPAWYSVLSIATHLLLFMAIVVIVISLLSGPLKRHKEYDLKIFQALGPMQSPVTDRIMLAITYLGKHQFLIPVNLLLIAVFFFFSRHHWYAFNILVISLSSLLLMLLLKQLFRRARPESPLLFAARGKSFPSGHAMMSVCFYGFLLHILLLSSLGMGIQYLFAVALIALILLIGFSRVYLRVHYVTDVLAGFIIGSAWLYVALQVFKKLEEVNVI
jgi:undecaprenyl-diphosphatase